jgi:hypothetical protein
MNQAATQVKVLRSPAKEPEALKDSSGRSTFDACEGKKGPSWITRAALLIQ